MVTCHLSRVITGQPLNSGQSENLRTRLLTYVRSNGATYMFLFSAPGNAFWCILQGFKNGVILSWGQRVCVLIVCTLLLGGNKEIYLYITAPREVMSNN